jgi:hypothetical protein
MYAYGEYYPEDIFIQKIKPEIAFNFFNSVLRKIPPEKAQFFYSMIPKDKERHYCGFIKSLELWRSIKLEGKPYKKLWYEPEEFKFEGRTLKLPWQIDDHYFKATSNSGFTVASKKLGFNLREFILAPPEDVWIIPPLMVLERLNEQNIVLVVSDDVRILRSVESLVGCIYALTTSRLAALITGSSISKWRKSLPSDRDLILDETNSLIDQAFRAPLGVVARLNAEYEYDQELPWLSNYFTYRFRHDLPLVCTYLRKNVDRLTNLVLFKEIATLYPENIASVLSGYASVMVIKDTK